MTAATARMPSGARCAMVLAHLRDHPGLTAGEIARAFGLRSPMLDTMRRLEQRAQVVAVTSWMPDQGAPGRRWQVAPPGTVPPPRPPEDPQAIARQRERDRLATRARRARARGLHVAPGLEPPSLRHRLASAADLDGAACRAADPELFFAADDERPAERETRVAWRRGRLPWLPGAGRLLRRGGSERRAIGHLGRRRLHPDPQAAEGIVTAAPEAAGLRDRARGSGAGHRPAGAPLPHARARA